MTESYFNFRCFFTSKNNFKFTRLQLEWHLSDHINVHFNVLIHSIKLNT